MKGVIYLLFILVWLPAVAQKLQLKISGTTDSETKIIDSLGYLTKHFDSKSIVQEMNALSQTMTRMGYLQSKTEAFSQVDENTVFYKIDFGLQTKKIVIGIDKQLKTILGLNKDTVVIKFSDNDMFLKSIVTQLEAKGFSMAKIKLDRLSTNKNNVVAELKAELNQKRQINDIVVNGYDKFPVGYLNNLKRLYKNRLFTKSMIDRIYNDIGQYRFIKQLKYPEILFTDTETKIYVYAEKAKNNTFDGFLGFTNDDKKNLILSGYVDLVLNNIINSAEKIAINWRSNGKEQRNFSIGVELPYVFKSPLALKANLNIVKQDSTFQTTQTNIDVGYYVDLNSKIYLGYQSSESSAIKNASTALLSDFISEFATLNFEFLNFKNDAVLFAEKTNLNLKIGTGNRNTKLQNNAQYFVNALLKHDIYLNAKNCINIKSQNFYLKSDTYIINELFRFGGINSVRGFNENSLQATFLTSILTEYRYIAAPNLYVHTIIDYAQYQDKATNASGKLLGIGFGFGLVTKNGLLNLIYANGSTQNQAIQLSNSIVQLSLKVGF